MKTFRRIAGVAALAVLATGVARADDSNWGVGIKAGTLGYGAEARWSGLPWIDLRIGANGYQYEDTGRHSGVRYDTDLTLETYYLTANFHFPLSPMRFTAGAMSNGNEAVMIAAEPGDITIGGQTFTQAEIGTLGGVTNFSSVSPYVGLGFDFELFGKVGLNLDLGVLWQGDPDIELVAVGGTLEGTQALNDALAAEIDSLSDDFSTFKAYPVVSLSFVYNF